jgi:hypothetical protein
MQKPQSRQSVDFSRPSLTIYINRFIRRLSSPFLFCDVLRIYNSVAIVYGGNDRDGMMWQFVSECKKRIGVDVEHSLTFVKAAIIKKKNLISELQLAVDHE